MTREEVIDLLLQNIPTVISIVNQVEARQLEQDTNLFDEEIRSQFLSLVRGELVNQLYNSGLTITDISVIIDEEELNQFIKEVIKNERNQ